MESASRSLTITEQLYSQAEREAFAIVWACEHLHLYVYGKPVTIYTDHEHAAETSRQQKVAEEYVCYLATTSTPKALKIQDIEEATQSDATLKAVAEAIAKGKWHHVVKHRCVNVEEFRLLERVKDELTVSASGDQILRGTRLVIPKSLHEHVVNLAPEGHQRKEVSVDFAEIPNKEYLLLITGDYSRYPVVEIVKSTAATTTIPKLDKVSQTLQGPIMALRSTARSLRHLQTTSVSSIERSLRNGQD